MTRRRSRGTTSQRGYPYAHRMIRERLAPIVALGRTACSRCGAVIAAGDPWDLDHADDRGGYLGPAHRRCNRGWRRRLARPQSRGW